MRTNTNPSRMGTLLARNVWTVALRGIIAILFGIAIIVWPAITLAALIALFGFFALIGGFALLIAAIRQRRTDEPWWLLLLEGISGIVIGIVVFIWPNITAFVLLYLIAAWAIISGIFEIVAAVQLRREIEGEWLLALSGIASIIFGLLLAIWPGAGALAILWIIGIYAIFFGLLKLSLAFRLRDWKRREPPTLI